MTEQEFLDSFRKKAEEGLKLWDDASVAVGIIKGGKIVLSEGFGFRNIEKELPADDQTLYQIGSCTKAFTAALVAILVDQGKLDWDTPIRSYVPDITLYDSFASDNCTLRDLMSHRTGLPRHEYSWYGTDFTRKEMVEHLKYLEPSQPFRRKFQYNNYGYILAGHIVETVTGKTYEECLQEYLFTPLGMNRSNCYVDDIEQNEDHATPYDRPTDGDGVSGKVEIPFYRTAQENKEQGIGAPFAAAGAINSSVQDMLKWVQFHLDNGKWNGEQIVSPQAMEEMHKPSMLLAAPLDMPMPESEFHCYGMGWFSEMFRGHKFIHHGGSINGFSAFTGFVPELDLGVVAYTNMNGTYVHYALARTIVDHYLGREDENWVQRYHDFILEKNGSLDEVIKHFTGEKVEGTATSHPIPDYAGTYRRDGYSDCIVKEEDGGLVMYYIGAVIHLRHFHYDTFVTDGIVGELPPGIPAHFHTAEVGGAIDSLAMPLVTEEGGSLVRFVKEQ